jgi:hypothetical protein
LEALNPLICDVDYTAFIAENNRVRAWVYYYGDYALIGAIQCTVGETIPPPAQKILDDAKKFVNKHAGKYGIVRKYLSRKRVEFLEILQKKTINNL